MKIEKFLKWIQERLLNYPDIHFATVKMFMDKFFTCLSPIEMERHSLAIQMISEMTLKQITIDSIVNNIKVVNLDNQLTKLKEKVE